ncbi:ABC transporter ATP-binding protein [Ostreibacterium oceani]|uniref:ABC transporter ATP-binding protein n=1 Tax=Ostreibacterium oceani TaxID=2654998 RepID=UPI0022A856BE
MKSALFNRPYPHDHSIIESVSLRVARGESLGIIGENGAGKSTLLKLISGVLHPTHGTVTCHGRISALLELGAGFHPEYSGLENIKMNAVLSGLSGPALAEKLTAIIDFADIGEYIHEPIKHYSSGMVVRLGFAMMTALSPDLLITDEVLAVGDESFQKKCIAWMQSYLASGGTLLLCSHGMYHIQKLCTHALWMENGRIRQYGSALDVTQAYLSYHEKKSKKAQSELATTAISEGQYSIQSATLCDADGQALEKIKHQSDLYLKGVVYSPDGRSPVVAVGINRSDGSAIYGMTSAMDDVTLTPIDEKHFAFTVCYPTIALLPGQFIVNLHAMDPEAIRLFDTYELPLTVQGDLIALGSVYLNHHWIK